MEDPRKSCMHETFKAEVEVFRLTRDDVTEAGDLCTATGEPREIVDGFLAEMLVRCVDCGCQFSFRGVDRFGVSPHVPTISADGKTLRAPLAPPEVLPELI